MFHQFRPSVILAAATVLTLAGCDSPATTPPDALLEFSPASATSASLSPAVSLALGDSLNAAATSALAKWALNEGQPMTWTSSAPATASVTSKGMVKGLKLGSSMIVLAASKWRDSIPVTVTAVVTSLTATASKSSFAVGATSQITVVARDKNGSIVTNPSLSFSSLNTALATVPASGLVTGIAVGSVSIKVSSSAATTSVALTITAGSPPPPPPPPPPGGGVVLPTPPQLINFTYPRVTGTTWTVANGGNLQQALNNAQRGDEVVIAAGATFTGTFTLPAKPGTAANGWIIVRSDKQSQLPPQGTRVTPSNAYAMPKLVTPSVYPVLQTAPSASGWWVTGLELTMSTTLKSINYGLVLIGDGSAKQTQITQVPSDIVLDRVYIHANPTTLTSRCIALNSARTAVQDSYVHECHLKGFDSQAIAGWNGPGPFKIVNNTLAGAGENIMWGGSDPKIAGLIPSDIEIRRNYVYTPASWLNVWTKKNLVELKNARRVLMEANVFDGSWADAQVGYAMLFKSVNQSGACKWCASSDITVRNNIIRNAGAGFNLTGKEGSSPYPVGALLTRVLIEQNIVENIMVGQYVGDAKFFQLLQNLSELTVRNNTMSTTGRLGIFLAMGSKPAATNADFHNNIFSFGVYGLFSSAYGSGEISMQNVNGTATYANHVLIGPWKTGYPASTFAASYSAAVATSVGANLSAVAGATAGVVIP